MHTFVIAPFLGVPRLFMRGSTDMVSFGKQINAYEQLAQLPKESDIPSWLQAVIRQKFGVEVDGSMADNVLVRQPSSVGMSKASYELSLGCDYDCPHCYLGEKPASSLSLDDRFQLLGSFADSGVVILQMTGGEVLIDRYFEETYLRANELGMMVKLSSNGSRLHKGKIQDVLMKAKPFRITLSVYGASAEAYARVTSTRNEQAFNNFIKGVEWARSVDINLRFNIVVTNDNQHERDDMVELANGFGVEHHVYDNITPTFRGEDRSLGSQSQLIQIGRKSKVQQTHQAKWTDCTAGTTFFHCDPHGKVSICMIARDSHVQDPGNAVQFDLLDRGVDALTRLSKVSDSLLTRNGGCTDCSLSSTCKTCPPIARLSRYSGRDPVYWCQH